MNDEFRSFDDTPPPYRSVLQSSSYSVDLSPTGTPDPSSTSRPTPSRRHQKACIKAATLSRVFLTSIFGRSKTAVYSATQVLSVTQDFLRDLLLQARPSEHEWRSLLGNCAETCNAHGLNFSAILQEPFIEGNLPVYWAILKRPAAAVRMVHHMTPTAASDPDALVLAILDASLPLNSLSVADARLACVTVSDNALFARLGQRYEAFSPRSGTDKMLLGGNDTVDAVSVEEIHGAGAATSAAFNVRFSLTQFQLRMRVSKQVRVEFVARGRLWYLAFSVTGVNTGPPQCASRAGEWLVSLGLGEHSSPTWVDARLSIIDQSPLLSTPDPSSVNLASLDIQTSNDELSPFGLTSNDEFSPFGLTHEIVVSLDKFLFGATLKNDAMSFVDADGTLNTELKVKLQKAQREVELPKAQREVELPKAQDSSYSSCVVS